VGQVAVYSGVERRRRWDEDTRLKILSQAFAPGANIAQVDRCHETTFPIARAGANSMGGVL